MSIFSNQIVLVMMLVSALAGLALHGEGFNYFPALDKFINGPFIFGMIMLMHSMLGLRGITDKPAIIDKVLNNKVGKFVTFLLMAFATTRDKENAIFVAIAFLAVTQLLRTKEEREKKPYIL